jgi:hypothetical protein
VASIAQHNALVRVEHLLESARAGAGEAVSPELFCGLRTFSDESDRSSLAQVRRSAGTAAISACGT